MVVAGQLVAQSASRSTPLSSLSSSIIQAPQLQTLIVSLKQAGYEVIGPLVRDGAIVYEPMESTEQLPRGWHDDQDAGKYRIRLTNDPGYFSYGVGPHSWKRYLCPAEMKLWRAERENNSFRILNDEPELRIPLALLGVRACELAAIALQDRVLLGPEFRDPTYERRRRDLFIIAVHCVHSAGTCFCVSMGTGPRATSGFDLLLTELVGEKGHRFLVEAGSDQGETILCGLEKVPATEEDLREAAVAVEPATLQTRNINSSDIRDVIYQAFDHPRWDLVAARCLACANCTMVCPTCFCTTVEDGSDLTGQRAERWRRWDSCFTLNFSYIHGGSVRTSSRARYRQWLTHKFASWHDQFGSSGCVGCGRCITWCPAGIDVTEELRALREGVADGNT